MGDIKAILNNISKNWDAKILDSRYGTRELQIKIANILVTADYEPGVDAVRQVLLFFHTKTAAHRALLADVYTQSLQDKDKFSSLPLVGTHAEKEEADQGLDEQVARASLLDKRGGGENPTTDNTRQKLEEQVTLASLQDKLGINPILRVALARVRRGQKPRQTYKESDGAIPDDAIPDDAIPKALTPIGYTAGDPSGRSIKNQPPTDMRGMIIGAASARANGTGSAAPAMKPPSPRAATAQPPLRPPTRPRPVVLQEVVIPVVVRNTEEPGQKTEPSAGSPPGTRTLEVGLAHEDIQQGYTPNGHIEPANFKHRGKPQKEASVPLSTEKKKDRDLILEYNKIIASGAGEVEDRLKGVVDDKEKSKIIGDWLIKRTREFIRSKNLENPGILLRVIFNRYRELALKNQVIDLTANCEVITSTNRLGKNERVIDKIIQKLCDNLNSDDSFRGFIKDLVTLANARREEKSSPSR